MLPTGWTGIETGPAATARALLGGTEAESPALAQ